MNLRLLLATLSTLLLASCSSSVPPRVAATASPRLETTVIPVWKIQPGTTPYYINSVAISGDGSRVVGGTFFHSYGATTNRTAAPAKAPAASGGGSDGTYGVYCYNAAGTALWQDTFQAWQGVYWVDISANGAYAAGGGWMTQSPYAGFVRAYNAATGANLLTYATASRVNQVALSADGTWLVSGAESLVLFQLQNGAYRKIAEVPAPGTNGSIVTLAMSADGSRIVTADSSGNITLWGNFGPKSLAILKQAPLPNSGFSHCVRITPDGSAFVSGGTKGNFYFYLAADFQNTGLPSATQTFAGGSSVYGVAIADDASAYLGMANYNSNAGQVMFVNRTTPANGWTFDTQHNPNCASINLAAGIVAVADGHPDGTPGTFYSINATNGQQNWAYTAGNMSWPIQISTQGNGIAAGSDDGNMYYFKP